MRSRKLLVLAGTAGLALSALASTSSPQRAATPLVDQQGRAAPGNVIGKGDPRPVPKPDGGTPRS